MEEKQGSEYNIIRVEEAAKMVGVSRSTIWRWVKTNEFPKQVVLGPRCSGWPRDEVLEWIANRISKRSP